MATPPPIIEELVERFGQNIEAYKSPAYNETRLRREFIDPFWEALGWDIANKAGFALPYQDVLHEDSLKMGGTTKAPDYSFRVGGQRKFFLETKKPAVNVQDDPEPAYQLRRYAWTAKLPLSVLTDFEHTAVYDGRVRPKPGDRASAARVNLIPYTEYLDKWDEIASVFSKEAVYKGSFDKYASAKKAKRGTAEVDAEFLKELDRWREELAKNLALRNPLNRRDLNYAVQMTIDRIVFLRMCEDRGIEPERQLQALLNGPNIYPRLVKIFEAADEKYNSGLFHFRDETGQSSTPDQLTLSLKVDDKTLKDILSKLYYPESPYEFRVLPLEILGTAYERFLGKVITLGPGGRRARVEEKPEVRKAGGVYYTPQYIVDYIVRNTVGRMIEGKSPEEISSLKVLDPACGSGSFLLGAYRYLLDHHLDWYTTRMKADGKVPVGAGRTMSAHHARPEEGRPQGVAPTGVAARAARGRKGRQAPPIYQGRGGLWFLTIAEKKRVLLNHIFGVDIDPQAVEVTKLSLLLKVLEHESEETLQSAFLFHRERALPDLGGNIKCGNALIGTDFNANKQGTLFDEDEQYRINAFDWGQGFPAIMKRGGFDCVIGNPPYVRQELIGNYKAYFQRKYKVYNGTADLYSYFIERGVSLLRQNGLFSFIVANKWMRAIYGKPLREWMSQQCLQEVVDFGDLPVFQKATTYPCILRIAKSTPTNEFAVVRVGTLSFDRLDLYCQRQSYVVSKSALSNNNGWDLATEKASQLLKKLEASGVALGRYVHGKIYRGILTGANEAFVIDREIRTKLIESDPSCTDLIRPFVTGREVKRYQPVMSERFLIFARRGVNISKYPAIENYLTGFKKKLLPKPKNWKGKKWPGRKPGSYEWYEIQDTVDYYREFEKPKIVVPSIVQRASCSFDEGNVLSNDKTSIIVTDQKYLLGLLNSKLLDFFIHSIASTKQGGYFEYKPMYLERLPIRAIDFSNPADVEKHGRMVSLVESMLDLHKRLQAARTPQEKEMLQRQIDGTDGQIDALVYELYGLTGEEIKIVEEGP